MDVGRHLIFATPAMLRLLERAERWYLDGTFKAVRRPFTQLFSIHAFVKKGGKMKHVPLCFVVMSHRRKRDYRAVFKAVRSVLPSVAVKEVLSDFEAAVWRTFRNVFGDDVTHRGCVFH